MTVFVLKEVYSNCVEVLHVFQCSIACRYKRDALQQDNPYRTYEIEEFIIE